MTTETETRTIESFIADNGIWYEWKPASKNPNMADTWAKDANHYLITLQRGVEGTDGYVRMDVPFSQGSAHVNAPTIADVLDCLASDAAGYQNARGFEDWCAEYGYDTDSRRAEKTYHTIQGQTVLLQRFLGHEAFEALLWNVERL